MPSALENLVKILKLEREQDARNAAVVGGLSAFCTSWEPRARRQARRPKHHILIDEIVDRLSKYDELDADERISRIDYVLARIMHRQPPPQEYKDRLPIWEAKLKAQRPPKPAHSDRRDARPGGRGGRPKFIEDSAALDRDYSSGPRTSTLDIRPAPRLARPPRQARPPRTAEAEQALQQELQASTTQAKGIGEKMAEALRQIDLHSIRDLLYHFPRDYQDYTHLKCIQDLSAGETVTVLATATRSRTVVGRGKYDDLLVEFSDGSGRLSVRFFGQAFLASRLQPGKQVVLSGRVRQYQDVLQMANPEWELLAADNLHAIGIVPIYRLTKELRPRLFRRTMKALTDEWAEKMPDAIPQTVLDRGELADLGWAIQQRHFPAGSDHRHHAQRRLLFDDLLMLHLTLLGKRREWQSSRGPALEVSDEFLRGFISAAFPFELTSAQQRAIADIRRDVSPPLPMNRLIQGDVGAGKTAVALVAMAMALANGRQAALMAPTGILAEQHYRHLRATFDKIDSEQPTVIALLTSSLSASERESIYRGMADGSIDIVVGTHALIQEGAAFDDLGIAVIDEQHRFGVDQRGRLRGKGQNPHLLVMTATPIPRTLALTFYADLDLTVMDEIPPGRQTVHTELMETVARERLYGFVTAALEQGRQAFFVYPLVSESETSDAASATAAYDELRRVFFRHRVCLLHGQMPPQQKDEVMRAFAAHQYDVMVTTTVTESGVDVPNATIIVIEGANRFGLAQLHQLRGRVGRGAHQSHCFLIPQSSGDISPERIDAVKAGQLDESALSLQEQRLAAILSTSDGFELAEVDYRLRGAGELLGRLQSGQGAQGAVIPAELIQLAQREAQTLYAEDPELQLPEHQLLANRIHSLHSDSGDVS